MTLDERAESGAKEHAGKGMCRRCWTHSRRDLPERLERLQWVAEEYEALADPRLSQRANATLLAPRLGLAMKTLEKYLGLLRSQGRLPALPPRVGLDGRLHDRQEIAA